MSTPYSDSTEAANAAASVNITHRVGYAVVITDLVWSYVGAGAAGGLTIVGQSSGWRWEWDGLGQGYGAFTINADGLEFQPGEDVVVTLKAGGAGVAGKLAVGAKWRKPSL